MPVIDYVYSAHSAFAYLGAAHLYALCARHDVRLVHRPILLSPVVEAQGSLPFRARTQAHVDYFFGREIERWAELRGVQILSHRPTYHDADYALASGLILALGEAGPAVDDLSYRLLEAHWRDDIDLSNPAALIAVADTAGQDGPDLLARAGSPALQERLKANSDWARTQAVFGSPTYIVDGDPFYGQDRLDLVARALDQPFGPAKFINPKVDD